MQDLQRDLAIARELLKGPPDSVHLLGIAGVGMAGVARLLAARGWQVSGCDPISNRLTRWLEGWGVRVSAKHEACHIDERTRWVIYTPAVPRDHGELAAASARRIAISRRGAVLAALVNGTRSIAIAGTHGKTTTTAMVASVARAVLPGAGYAIGGEVPGFDGVAAPPAPNTPLVVEADESDGTLVLYEPDVAVITNVDFDHMEHFASEEEFFDMFRRFAKAARQALVLGADDPRARDAAADAKTICLCGLSADAQVRAESLKCEAERTSFELRLEGRTCGRIELPVPGLHNVRNALCAIGVAHVCGWPLDAVRDALARFRPARRRLERVYNHRGVEVYSDYAHHPTEIEALIRTLRLKGSRRLLAVFQPHRYTRTRALARRFAEVLAGADRLWLLPVYAASEPPLEDGTTEAIARHIAASDLPKVQTATSFDEVWEDLAREMHPGDIVAIIGAGDIEKLAERFRELWQKGECSVRFPAENDKGVRLSDRCS